MEKILIKDNWRFCEAKSGEWIPVSMPGTVLSGLLEAGKMEDPYYRENEYEAREILAKDYEFETEFGVPDTKWLEAEAGQGA